MVSNDARHGWPGLAMILLLAVGLRLLWALFVPVSPISDASIYDIFAREIAAGHGYVFPDGSPTVYWPVGPSALYGFFYALFGTHGWAVALPNIVMGTALVAGIYRLALLRFGERVASIAGLIAALWPIWVQFTTTLSSELPFTLLLIAALLVRMETRMPGWGRIVLSTVLLAAAAYMRPTILPLVILYPLTEGACRRPARAALHLVLAVAVATALLAPWAARNRALFGAPVLISANFGANLWMGNNPASNGGYMPLPEIDAPTEIARDAYFKEQALDFIRTHPIDYLGLCVKRIALSFDRETIGIVWNEHSISPALQPVLKLVSSLYWLAVFLLSLIGVGLFLWRKPLRIFDPLVVTPGLFAAVALLVVGQDRYHMPIMPFVALFAALAIAPLTSRRRKDTAITPRNATAPKAVERLAASD